MKPKRPRIVRSQKKEPEIEPIPVEPVIIPGPEIEPNPEKNEPLEIPQPDFPNIPGPEITPGTDKQ